MRPEFHFTPQSGWINDPHGITYRDGGYDTFFQYVPDQTVWGPNCHWGHARGTDLFSLEELPVAIAPGEGDGGIWTGSLVTGADGHPRVFYTSTSEPDIGIGRIRIATPDDAEWISWSKGPFPVDAPADLDLIAYRDPFLRQDPDDWRMFVGAGDRGGTAMALSYRSGDLDSWTYEGVALERSTREVEDVWMGALWECPQIIDVDGRAVMVSSVWDDDVLHYAGYAVGDYEAGRFSPRHWGRLTWGDSHYAPSFFRDEQDRPCLIFWMRGIADVESGWASAHSIPYVLTLTGDVLVATPHPDIEKYRTPVRDGYVSGLAADIMWGESTRTMSVSSEGEPVVFLERIDRGLRVLIHETETVVPLRGNVRVVIDGPVLEISSGDGIFGAAVRPRGTDLRIDTDDPVIIHALSR